MDKQTISDTEETVMKIYHTETQADYDALMVELEEQGAKWSSGTNPTEANHWSEFKRQTGVRLQNCILTYHGVGYYERVNPETPIIKYTAKKETKLPEWANWLARDKKGDLWAYSGEPLKADGFWDLKNLEDSGTRIEETDNTFEGILWTDDEPVKVADYGEHLLERAESLKEMCDALNRNWEAEHGKPSVAEYNQWQITQAKAHGYDELPVVADKTERVYVVKDGAKITVGETTSISFEEAMDLVENKVDDIADKCYETPDIINEPNHYKGKHGIETIDVIRNFGNDDMVAGFYWGNAIKYMTRYRNKNGLEDLNKARKNLDWLIEHTEKVE